MPMLIKPIDHISIDKQRDVLFVKFDYVPDSLSQDDHECVLEKDSPWELMPVRNQLIAFLDSVGIGWCECSGISWSGWVVWRWYLPDSCPQKGVVIRLQTG